MQAIHVRFQPTSHIDVQSRPSEIVFSWVSAREHSVASGRRRTYNEGSGYIAYACIPDGPQTMPGYPTSNRSATAVWDEGSIHMCPFLEIEAKEWESMYGARSACKLLLKIHLSLPSFLVRHVTLHDVMTFEVSKVRLTQCLTNFIFGFVQSPLFSLQIWTIGPICRTIAL